MDLRSIQTGGDGSARVVLPKDDLRDDGVISEDGKLEHSNAVVKKVDKMVFEVKIIDVDEI